MTPWLWLKDALAVYGACGIISTILFLIWAWRRRGPDENSDGGEQ